MPKNKRIEDLERAVIPKDKTPKIQVIEVWCTDRDGNSELREVTKWTPSGWITEKMTNAKEQKN